ncbi:invasion associated locus B family protein [Pseudooceanicola sp. C21-150M6]|uniref:invasion associated locus B family protein n=1 Tax=Pseudooceanicola sp. C21-150M6 TaxID=3434355 RepID=UPI003D7F8BFD
MNTKAWISALALAAFAGGAIAQTTTDAAPEPETEQPAETAETADSANVPTDLDTGQPAGEQAGGAYLKEKSGDWDVQCIKADDPAKEPCQLYQLLRGAENNPVAEVIIEKLPSGGNVAAGATIIVPLGTALNRDMRISVDGAQGKVYRYAFCDGNACYARIGLVNDDITAFKAGSKATLTIFPYESQNQAVNLNLSLSGFTAGFTGLSPVPAPSQ